MRVGILGGGESGVGAARLAAEKGCDVFVSDNAAITNRFRDELKLYGVPFEEKGHTLERLVQNETIVKSPGIPGESKIVEELRSAGVEVISEVEFAYRHCTGKIIGITGSNGKTTTASLCFHLLHQAGVDVAICGNVGYSFARSVAEGHKDWFVVEVSSFQLDDVVEFRPDIGILLNITRDHLDRYHGDFELYAQAKMRLPAKMGPGDVFIYNASDPTIGKYLGLVPEGVSKVGISMDDEPPFDLGHHLDGAHNMFNAIASIRACREAGLSDARMMGAFETFRKPAHRMESVATVNGVEYINDSKATNVESVYYALDAVSAPVVWIAGGLDKGNDYAVLDELVETKVSVLICLGIDNRNLIKAFSSKVQRVEEASSAAEAVRLAASHAPQGATVLLSPACASFDLFQNYIDRGNQFKRAVKAMEST